jgi:photosystem II stability/assembly factor-like uncharacterized protein
VAALVIDPSTLQTVYAGSPEDGVFKSTDGGNNWITLNVGLTSPYIYALAIDPVAPLTLYAGTNVAGVFKSTDGGSNWVAINTGLPITWISALAIDPSEPQTLYASSYNGGIFKSTDGGNNWIAANTGLTSADVYALAIDPSAPQTLYAGSYHGGVFKSTDGGGGWNAINTGLTIIKVGALAIDPSAPQILYAGTYDGGGVFKSTNGGVSRARQTTVCPALTPHITAIAVDPGRPQTVYAATGGGGEYKSRMAETIGIINTGLGTNVHAPDCQRHRDGICLHLWGCMGLFVTLFKSCLSAGGADTCDTGEEMMKLFRLVMQLTVESVTAPYGTAGSASDRMERSLKRVSPHLLPTVSARVFIDYCSGVDAVPGRSDAGTIDINIGTPSSTLAMSMRASPAP